MSVDNQNKPHDSSPHGALGLEAPIHSTRLWRSRSAIIISVLTLFVIILSLAAFRQGNARNPVTIAIATGTEGGTYNVLGSQLTRLLNQQQPVSVHFSAQRTEGDDENLDMLLNHDADIAFVTERVLTERKKINPQLTDNIRIVAKLYPTVVQFIVRNTDELAPVTELAELHKIRSPRPLRVFIGAERSGTRLMGRQLFESCQMVEGENYVVNDKITRYADAAQQVTMPGGSLDIALFAAGWPTEAVENALSSGGCHLIAVSVPGGGFGTPGLIPANTYTQQPDTRVTVKDDVYLVCNPNIPDSCAASLMEMLLDNVHDLLFVHMDARNTRLEALFSVPDGFALHDGVSRLREKEAGRLLIATGPFGGEYYSLGKGIQALLKERGIPSRVVPTDGSVANLVLLNSVRPTIAILQHDITLASLWSRPEAVYKSLPERTVDQSEWGIPFVSGLGRIAALHEETVYVFKSKQCKSIKSLEDLDGTDHKVCLGPENSGTHVLAQAILAQTQKNDKRIRVRNTVTLPVADMIKELSSGQVVIGFAVSGDESELLGRLVNATDKIEILSVPETALRTLQGLALVPHRITAGHIGIRDEDAQTGSPARFAKARQGMRARLNEPKTISTLKTRAVLVANDKAPSVQDVTKTIFEGAGIIELDEDSLRRNVASVPLHRDALKYYQARRFLPYDDAPHFVEVIKDWLPTSTALLPIVSLAYGLARYQRRTAKHFRRILQCGVEGAEAKESSDGTADNRIEWLRERQESAVEAVKKLRYEQEDIRKAACKRWWERGFLTEGRWRRLNQLIDARLRMTREEGKEAYMGEVLEIKRGDAGADPKVIEEFEKRVSEATGIGALDSEQADVVCRVLRQGA